MEGVLEVFEGAGEGRVVVGREIERKGLLSAAIEFDVDGSAVRNDASCAGGEHLGVTAAGFEVAGEDFDAGFARDGRVGEEGAGEEIGADAIAPAVDEH